MSVKEDLPQLPSFRNPIIDADWPDPDVIRVGDEYFATVSSFNRVPGLPVLRSTDLVNWERIGYALRGIPPLEHYRLPRHGSGVWAPSIRHHNGVFHIVYPDPDHGIFVVSAKDPAGEWSEPRPLLLGVGLIDPCPLWDEDGSTYLVHGWAASRSGRKNVLTVVAVDAGLTHALAPGVDVIDGNALPGYTTLEGPKFYRRDDWYWIFAPAGGVATGWQSAFRSRSPYGPYEERIVLAQGDSPTNGPHQGAWVEGVDGDHWFIHFQDRGVYGRVMHLQPMEWRADGWPVIGEAGPDETTGQPVIVHPVPGGNVQIAQTLAFSDTFSNGLNPGWYWQANPGNGWVSTGTHPLNLSGPANDTGNLRLLPQLLGQQLPGRACVAAVTVTLDGTEDSRAGLAILGRDYLWSGLRSTPDGTLLVVASRRGGELSELIHHTEHIDGTSASVRIEVDASAGVLVHVDGGTGSTAVDPGFTAVAGHWIGADIALFAAAPLGAQQPAAAGFGPFTLEVSE
ncbi:MAG: xynB 2 [Glaciihabitans sp.]|nr:xynB 2 [Glaciihabitans sp.]